MIRLIIIVLALSISNSAWANEFAGKWIVTEVDMPESYYGEIRYPKFFELVEKDGKIVGTYKDQYDFECAFALSETVNAGNELLLMNCGTTKHSDAWAPLHKVKFINGKLVGSVVTYNQQFVWTAEPTDSLPYLRRKK